MRVAEDFSSCRREGGLEAGEMNVEDQGVWKIAAVGLRAGAGARGRTRPRVKSLSKDGAGVLSEQEVHGGLCPNTKVFLFSHCPCKLYGGGALLCPWIKVRQPMTFLVTLRQIL